MLKGVLNQNTAGANGWESLSPSGTPLVPTVDNQSRLIVAPYSHRQGIVSGTIAAAVLGIAGTATLIAASAASFIGVLAWEIQASAATTVTLESPAATILWAWPLGIGGIIVITRTIPLYGANGQAIILRTSAAATISANAIGIAHK